MLSTASSLLHHQTWIIQLHSYGIHRMEVIIIVSNVKKPLYNVPSKA